jgi:hypothetical protein
LTAIAVSKTWFDELLKAEALGDCRGGIKLDADGFVVVVG